MATTGLGTNTGTRGDDIGYLISTTMTDLDNITADGFSTTTEEAYSIWDDPESKHIRRTVYYVLHGVVGLITVLFNGFVLCIYNKRAKIQKHTSFIMLNVFISCFIHGWIVGIIYPLQRVYRYVMSDEWCIITTLIMDWADRYILLLLPFLAMERLVYLKFPFLRKARTKRPVIIVSICLLIGSALYTWLPLIPQLEVPEGNIIKSPNSKRQEEITAFYRAYTCHGKINKKNRLEPYFILAVSTLCVLVVVVVYIWMFMIAKARFAAFPHMTQRRKYKMKKAAISVMLVSMTFIFTLMPYGIIHPIRNLCETDVSSQKNAFCNGMTLELRFIFSVIAHMGNILAPLLFAFLNPHTRAAMEHYLYCNRGVKTICKSMKNREDPPYVEAPASDHRNQNGQPKAIITSYHTSAKNGFTSDYQRAYQLPTDTPDTLISPVDYL